MNQIIMKNNIFYFLFFSLTLLSCNERSLDNSNNKPLELMVLSDYGKEENIISKSTTKDQIDSIMTTLDWNEFHQVILSIDNENWIEVGGNIQEDGLAVLYEENGVRNIIKTPPNSVDEMTEILISYLVNDNKFKSNYDYE